MKTRKNDQNANTSEVRYCKKCGCELPSKYKRKDCDNCRRKNAKQWRELGSAALGVLSVAAVVVLPKLGKKE